MSCKKTVRFAEHFNDIIFIDISACTACFVSVVLYMHVSYFIADMVIIMLFVIHSIFYFQCKINAIILALKSEVPTRFTFRDAREAIAVDKAEPIKITLRGKLIDTVEIGKSYRMKNIVSISFNSQIVHMTNSPREDAGGLSREYVLRIPSVS